MRRHVALAAIMLAAGATTTITAEATTAAPAAGVRGQVTVTPPASVRPAQADPPQLVIDQDFPDPHVSRFGNTYYAYSTESGPNVPVATATSLNGPWTVSANDGLPNLGAWAEGGRTWAPDVSLRADGKYLLYYAAHSTETDRQCIGAALADDPAGPFVPVGDQPLVCNADEGGDIDPSAFVDTDGSHYLLYKNDGNSIGQPPSIWLQKVADDGVTLIGGRTELLRNDRDDEQGVIEAPVLVKRPSQYVLFYSQGPYTTDDYATGYATSPDLTGTYTKSDQPLLSTDGLGGAVHGPGGADVVQESSGDHIVFHGWINDNSARGMYVAELDWTNDEPVVPSG